MFDSAAPAKTVDPGQIDGVPADSAASVDVERLGRQLLGTWADIRAAARKFAANPQLHRVDGLTLEEQRERTMRQLALLAEHGAVKRAFPTEFGGQGDNGGNITSFEELVSADPSLQIKAGVHWGLFGSAVLQLGTRVPPREVPARHHRPHRARRVRDDRDRARVGCREHRHDGDVRPRRRASS